MCWHVCVCVSDKGRWPCGDFEVARLYARNKVTTQHTLAERERERERE